MSTEDLKYEQAIEYLSAIVDKMERGELTLEETIKSFEEGKRLISFCREQLKEAEGKLLKLSDNGEVSELDK